MLHLFTKNELFGTTHTCMGRKANATAAPIATAQADGAPAASEAARITAKAKLRAAELGVDPSLAAAKDGVIGVAEVEAYAAARPAVTAKPSAPAMVAA